MFSIVITNGLRTSYCLVSASESTSRIAEKEEVALAHQLPEVLMADFAHFSPKSKCFIPVEGTCVSELQQSQVRRLLWMLRSEVFLHFAKYLETCVESSSGFSLG